MASGRREVSARGSQPLAWIVGFKIVKGILLIAIGVALLATREDDPGG